MANYTKISNGEVLTECELYDYLNTAKGYCCEKGWIWRNDDNLEEKTGRQWKAYFEEIEFGWQCVPLFEYVVAYESGLDIVGFYVSNDTGTELNIIVDWGDGTITNYDGASNYDITYSYLSLAEFTIKVYIKQYQVVEVLDFRGGGTNVNHATSIIFNKIMLHMNDGYFDMSGNMLSSDTVNYILAYLLSIPCMTTIIDLRNQVPVAPPTGQGIIDKATLISNGCTVITD